MNNSNDHEWKIPKNNNQKFRQRNTVKNKKQQNKKRAHSQSKTLYI